MPYVTLPASTQGLPPQLSPPPTAPLPTSLLCHYASLPCPPLPRYRSRGSCDSSMSATPAFVPLGSAVAGKACSRAIDFPFSVNFRRLEYGACESRVRTIKGGRGAAAGTRTRTRTTNKEKIAAGKSARNLLSAKDSSSQEITLRTSGEEWHQ